MLSLPLRSLSLSRLPAALSQTAVTPGSDPTPESPGSVTDRSGCTPSASQLSQLNSITNFVMPGKAKKRAHSNRRAVPVATPASAAARARLPNFTKRPIIIVRVSTKMGVNLQNQYLDVVKEVAELGYTQKPWVVFEHEGVAAVGISASGGGVRQVRVGDLQEGAWRDDGVDEGGGGAAQ